MPFDYFDQYFRKEGERVTVSLRITIFVAALLFTVIVLKSLKRKRISTKLSLLWIILGILLMAASIFSPAVIYTSQLLGFEEASNMVFFLGVLFLLLICLYMSNVISKQQRTITVLIQEISLNNKRMSDEEQEKE